MGPGHWLPACCLLAAGYVANKEEPVADFPSLVASSEFVDKTMFISDIFDCPSKKILLTAPPRTGKSTLLDMTRRFLEIEVNETGAPLTAAASRREAVRDTPNYRAFAGGQMRVAGRRGLMDHYLGKYPVIHADFKCAHDIDNSENAVVCFRQVVHQAFKRHRYLRKSEVLNTKEKRLVKKWGDSYGAYEKFFGQDVTNSLYKLAVVLHKHFGGRKVFVLVDNYEHPTARATFRLKNEKELARVLKFNLAIIAKLLSADFRLVMPLFLDIFPGTMGYKACAVPLSRRCLGARNPHTRYVDRAVVVGTSRAAAAGAHPDLLGAHFGFLGAHPFAEHFGLTEPEAERLFRAFRLPPERRQAARRRYGGYRELSGTALYSMHSTLRYLRTGEPRNYVVVSGLLKKLGRLFKIPFVRESVKALTTNGGVALVDRLGRGYSVEDVYGLVKVVKLRATERFDLGLVFTLLQEQGYFSYAPGSGNSTGIKIPNEEINSVFALKLKDYYDGICKIDKTALRKSASFFDSVSPSLADNKVHFKRALYWFYNSLERLLSDAKRRFAKLECDVRTVMFSVLHQAIVRLDGRYRVTVRRSEVGRLAGTLENDKFVFDVDARAGSVSRDVVGEMASTARPAGPKRRLLIGVGVADDWKTSVSCLLRGDNVSEAIHLP